VANSTLRAGLMKRPQKPRPDFPLFPHASGRWAKKVRGKFVYFGKVADDPKGEAALNLWLDQRDDLLAGRTPRGNRDGLTVRDLCNRFLTAKGQQQHAGDITPRSFADYFATAKLIVGAFGKTRLVDDLAADDFEALRASLAKTRNPNTLGNEVQRVRVVFKYGYDAGLIDKPVRYGPTFKRPAKRILRALRQKRGPHMFTAVELRTMIRKADQPLRAMIYLGINAGFGNTDCGTLSLSALNLETGWADYPRPKTAVERRCPLWVETVEAIREAIDQRPTQKAAEHAGLVFVTKYGRPWAKETRDNAITKEMRKLLDLLKLHRPGLGFYALRHTFETVADGSRDQVAVDFIMGRADQSMAGVYRETIDDDRLRAVVDHVHNWLFPRTEKR
jgi:integrase